MAAHHVHMRNARFRQVVAAGSGPRPWAHEVYMFPRYSVAELDRWLNETAEAAA
jgi:hypothetical protein